MTKSQPAASLEEFASLLEQAENLLGRMEDTNLIPLEDESLGRIPFYNERLKLRTHIRVALGADVSPTPQKRKDEE